MTPEAREEALQLARNIVADYGDISPGNIGGLSIQRQQTILLARLIVALTTRERPVDRVQSYRCSTCGIAGHSKRTCGRVQP